MKSAIRMPIAMPLASGLRPGGTATSRVSHSSSIIISSHRGEAREGSARLLMTYLMLEDLQSLNVVGLGSPNRLSHRIAAGHTE